MTNTYKQIQKTARIDLRLVENRFSTNSGIVYNPLSIKMGKKYFTRELNKEKSGHYVVLVFNIEGSKIDVFKARLKLSTDVFRYQFSALSEINSLASEV